MPSRLLRACALAWIQLGRFEAEANSENFKSKCNADATSSWVDTSVMSTNHYTSSLH